ncbi:MAG: uracil-DNA glycosylase, partial [Anaerolineae bacterium]|nr:uracil-DNA glycosylase [Anaerolineae bacterium]
GSHRHLGWERLTREVVLQLNLGREHLVFLLWGAHAQTLGASVDRQRHLALEAPHPSPLSAYRGFVGCGHFSQANAYLLAHGSAPIRW